MLRMNNIRRLRSLKKYQRLLQTTLVTQYVGSPPSIRQLLIGHANCMMAANKIGRQKFSKK